MILPGPGIDHHFGKYFRDKVQPFSVNGEYLLPFLQLAFNHIIHRGDTSTIHDNIWNPCFFCDQSGPAINIIRFGQVQFRFDKLPVYFLTISFVRQINRDDRSSALQQVCTIPYPMSEFPPVTIAV